MVVVVVVVAAAVLSFIKLIVINSRLSGGQAELHAHLVQGGPRLCFMYVVF